jgi:hypothetical protein
MPSSEVMAKWKAGKLKSGGSGKPVKSQAQAVAIMLSEKRKEDANGGKYPEGPKLARAPGE